MKLTQIVLPFVLSADIRAHTDSSAHLIDVNNYPNSTLDATAWALIYTYPLSIFASWAGGVLSNGFVNKIYHQRSLASLDSPGVIKPNIDTLYSKVVLDLSSQDVVLTVPNISDDRYWLYPVYDVFGNNIANIGAINGNLPGDYLIRRTTDASVHPGFVNTRNIACSDYSQYRGIVNVPSTYGTMLIRLLVKANTTEELGILHSYQDTSDLTPVNRTIATRPATQVPPLVSLALNGSLLGIQTPEQQFEFAARIVQHNDPETYTDRYRVASILARAGLYNGQYHAQPGINLTEAAIIANTSIAADVQDLAHVRQQSNEWQLSIPSYQGNYRTNYAGSAYVALAGYQQLTTEQALYPGFRSLSFTSLFNLEPDKSLLLTFSGKPQLGKYGFWSISLYGADQYLMPNSLSRFSVGDRTTSLRYPDGSPIYGPAANTSQDGPFQILVQPANITPPENWTSNWLPCDAVFSWITRWYVPEDSMTNGSWIYPLVENITAIRA